MNITFQPQNFTGNRVKTVQILKNNKPFNATLIELTKLDINCVESLAERWKTKIIEQILTSMYIPLIGVKNPKIYAISTQKENFQKVSPKNILGMFEVTERDNLYALEYLEVKPTQTYGNNKRTFSEVGKACLDYIKTRFRHKDVEIYAIETAAPFYTKMNCINEPKDNCKFRYIIPKQEE